MRRAVLLLVAVALVAALSGCGDRAARCTPLHKGFPLCGL